MWDPDSDSFSDFNYNSDSNSDQEQEELYCEKFLEGECMFGIKCYKQHLKKKQVLCINISEQNCENAQQNICKYRHIGEKSNKNNNQINQNQNAKTTEEEQPQYQYPCIQCNKNERAYAFIPCLHFNVCEKCVENMSNCKICGKIIQEKLKVYMV
ncbi:hypothetical protein PPERSA_02965 [Pseudocohnilembus persalinus]|uniref:RING-type domain-containing protein n=1 Tax=Pseudocohnilembus persalinus TaxID=266149 RepID=A0A0V0QA66_PSEPJ|nr:hypothetical protein PPERSA_02965 [Pseudocohnilembus persalinus]|eukprot:KRW99133.1 hypothetical protein PPERSA_02965 [Pseudocohnilembus persalinus]